MRVILFGGSGMVGQGVLRKCLLDAEVKCVFAIGRSSTGFKHEKLRESLHSDLLDLSEIEAEITGYDAYFFCLGVSSFGMTEEQYRYITFDITLAVAQTLAKLNPAMTFIYVSGAGTDSSESSRTMWARVKGSTENALLQLPFHAYMFRPAAIVPMHGIKSRTKSYRLLYALTALVLLWLYTRFPKYVTTTEQVGRAMIKAARTGAPKRVLENLDINRL
jgi:aspartate aminotransferase-like enzyme